MNTITIPIVLLCVFCAFLRPTFLLSLSSGMAGVTGLAVVGIAANIYMLIIHLTFTMRMAIDTGEFKVIGGPVTFGTGKMLMNP